MRQVPSWTFSVIFNFEQTQSEEVRFEFDLPSPILSSVFHHLQYYREVEIRNVYMYGYEY